MSYLNDDEAKRLAGWKFEGDVCEMKHQLVDLACFVAGVKEPTKKVEQLVLALIYDIPHEAESDPIKIISFLKLQFAMTWALYREGTHQTISNHPEYHDSAIKLLGMVIESAEHQRDRFVAAIDASKMQAKKEKTD